MTAQLAVYKKKPASLTLIQGMQRRGRTPTEGVAKGPFWAILRAVKLRFLSSLGIRAIVNNYHLGAHQLGHLSLTMPAGAVTAQNNKD